MSSLPAALGIAADINSSAPYALPAMRSSAIDYVC